VFAAFKTRVVVVKSRATEVGSVLWRGIPVSPAIPLSVIRTMLAAGGTIVNRVATAATGAVIVFGPVLRFTNWSYAGLVGLAAAVYTFVEASSPVQVSVAVQFASVDID
jgi:hypothetical protein